MKKIIPLVLFVLIVGFVAFFFLNNGMAMTTLISQDYKIVAQTYNKAVKGVTKHDRFYYETIEKTYVNGKVTTQKKVKVSIITKGDVVTKILAKVETNTEEKEVYFVVREAGAKTYYTVTPKGGSPTYTLYGDATADDVLDSIVGAKPVMFALDGVASKTTMQLLTEYTKQDAAQFKDKVSSSFTFSPLGAKYEYKLGNTDKYFAAIDILGKLHSIEHKSGTSTDYTITTTNFEKYDGKVSIYWKNDELFRGTAETNFH